MDSFPENQIIYLIHYNPPRATHNRIVKAISRSPLAPSRHLTKRIALDYIAFVTSGFVRRTADLQCGRGGLGLPLVQ